MQQTAVLDLAPYAPAPAGRGNGRSGSPDWLPNWLVAAAIATAVLVLIAAAPSLKSGFASLLGHGQPVQRISFDQARQVEAMTVDDKAQIVAQGIAAEEQNAAIPVSGLPLEQLHKFILGGSVDNYANALKCMTQAVYYEAANEPIQGRQAVAQVVLNRMRHPAYPKSVCGVVYQGAERHTGCQFSFTCDGSLLRTPMMGPWRAAEAVARAALGGFVETSVGTATHYHADYVLPKWAFQLAKIEQIGRHIFYRFPGQWGRALAFNGRYNQAENIPQIDYSALKMRADDSGLLMPGMLAPQLTPGLTVEPSASDRHAPTDVGGRLDMTKTWRLNIPDPTQASSHYNAVVSEKGEVSGVKEATQPVEKVASATEAKPAAQP